uniref:hypothetical protein n=1 Tax=Ningiella ruwaisensis TaxID=2364274 RepID=UPI00109F883C|nr:hypothetical protein [Ningiella ruwaisensis]
MVDKMPGYEKRKLTIDLLKHFGTLSLACIALLASFYSHSGKSEIVLSYLTNSVYAFFICVCGALVGNIFLLANIENVVNMRSLSRNIIRLSIYTVVISFFFGVFSLVRLVVASAV